MAALGIIGVILGIALMIYLVCWRNWNVLLSTLAASVLIALFNGMNVWTAISVDYLTGAAGWVQDMLLIFALGALFGRVLQRTGSAQALGKWLAKVLGKKNIAIVIFVLAWALVYGGIDNIVACLTICPIAIEMAKQANMPRRYVFAAFLGGACCFVMAMPGSPIIHNLMPTWFLGTSLTAASILGMAIVILNVLFEALYIHHLGKKFRKKGQGFDLPPDEDKALDAAIEENLPSPICGIVCLLIVIVSSILLGGILEFDSTMVVCAALVVAIAVNLIWCHSCCQVPVYKILEEGTIDGIMGCVLCAAVLGWVGVVQSTDAFSVYANWTNNMGSSIGYVGIFLSIQLMAIITGNSPGTLNVFLTNFSQNYIAMGLNPQVIHRLSSASCIGFDAMPHNPGTITYLRTFKHTYREAYVDVFFCCCVCPACAAFLGSLLALIGLC